MENKRDQSDVKTIRWDVSDWELLKTLSARVGITRAEFVRRAALGEAGRVLAGFNPYFVGGAQATTQNTRTNFSDPTGAEKLVRATGAEGVASAKGGDDKGSKKRSPKG